MKIVMLGAGYVGLVSGACFADFGHDVVCVDTDMSRVERLTAGQMPIYEPGLAELVAKNAKSGSLAFTADLAAAARGADVVFIAVGTPSRRGDGHADLSYVYAGARALAAIIETRTVVVTKSTVPVGTGDEIERIIRDARPGCAISVASNPEFLREGAAIEDFKRPNRIVIGANDSHARDVLTNVYRPLFLNQAPLMFTDRRAAEMIKYAANAFLAVKITFINEMADLCEATDVDVQDVARGIGLDQRIGSKFLHAGPGYGGSCFPKDTRALLQTARDHGVGARLVETVDQVNTVRKRAMARKVVMALGGEVRGKTIGVLGLTFKPNTDDMREAPSVPLITALQDQGASIRAYDPEGMTEAKHTMPDVAFAVSAYACAEGCDALVIVTEWDAFRALDLVRIKRALKQPIMIDLRNIYRPEDMRRHGFHYVSIGRPTVLQARS
jgi:UDPglucose 6-dehydrogenase